MSTIGVPYHREATYSLDSEEQQAARAARLRARDAEYRAALRIPRGQRLPKALGHTLHAHGEADARRELLLA